MENVLIVLSCINLIGNLMIMTGIINLKQYMKEELDSLHSKMEQRVNAFLEVFRKSKGQ